MRCDCAVWYLEAEHQFVELEQVIQVYLQSDGGRFCRTHQEKSIYIWHDTHR